MMKVVTLFFVLFSSMFSYVATAQADLKDSLALVDFYNSTHGPKWYNKTNWLTKNPLSEWYGIRLLDNRVDSIILPSNNLSDSIPSSLGNLTKIRYVNFYTNELSYIPNSIGLLSNVRYINCARNQIKRLPDSVNRLVNLRYLNLSDNYMKGRIPQTIGNCRFLQYLNFEGNTLTGIIPSSLGNLTHLTYLSIFDNKLESTIPTSIGNLINLDTLSIGGNGLTGTIPESIANLQKLKFLNIQDCEFHSELPSFLGKLINLTDLNFQGSYFQGQLPASLGNLTKLTTLNGSYNEFSGNIPESFTNLTNVVYLFFVYNKLSGPLPKFLGHLTSLLNLNLGYNQFSGSLPDTLKSLKKTLLVDISYNNLSGNLPSSLGEMDSLTWLYLAHNKITGAPPVEICNLTRLIDFDLSYNRLTYIPLNFNRPQLRTRLYLYNNNLSGDLPHPKSQVKNSFYIWNNYYNFTALEHAVDEYRRGLVYDPQNKIPIHHSNDVLSVTAGGTLSYNTYKWYKNGTLIKTVTGDSALQINGDGVYHATVTNIKVEFLELVSDTIKITNTNAEAIASTMSSSVDDRNIIFYPNPVKSYLYIDGLNKNTKVSISIVTEDGKAVKQFSTTSGSANIYAGNIKPGIYFIQFTERQKRRTFKFIKE